MSPILPPPTSPSCRSKALAQQVGAYHLDINIDTLVSCVVSLFSTITGQTPRFKVDGGTAAENLALQNIQVGPAATYRAGLASVRNMRCANQDHAAQVVAPTQRFCTGELC
jgi:hypothetical protein